MTTAQDQSPGPSVNATSRCSIVGTSKAIQDVWRQIETFAPTDISILLTGESGTGKELFARAIHDLSQRRRGPFIEVDCASFPENLIEAELFGHERGAFTDAKEARKGKFELASGGTLFLDELSNLSLAVQAKLLRVVQERSFRRLGGSELVEVDVRIVGATNLDLSAAIERQAFRADLYYRLAEMAIVLPALRDRAGDIPLLLEHFVEDYNRTFKKRVQGAAAATMALIERHSWPGNVRELRNVARAGMVLAQDVIEPSHLPGYFPRGAGCLQLRRGTSFDPFADGAVDDYRVLIPWGGRDRGLDLKALHQDFRRNIDRHILMVLRNAGLNKTQISRYLGLDYKVLLEKFRELGLA